MVIIVGMSFFLSIYPCFTTSYITSTLEKQRRYFNLITYDRNIQCCELKFFGCYHNLCIVDMYNDGNN